VNCPCDGARARWLNYEREPILWEMPWHEDDLFLKYVYANRRSVDEWVKMTFTRFSVKKGNKSSLQGDKRFDFIYLFLFYWLQTKSSSVIPSFYLPFFLFWDLMNHNHNHKHWIWGLVVFVHLINPTWVLRWRWVRVLFSLLFFFLRMLWLGIFIESYPAFIALTSVCVWKLRKTKCLSS
jgi:hypothetical protein